MASNRSYDTRWSSSLTWKSSPQRGGKTCPNRQQQQHQQQVRSRKPSLSKKERGDLALKPGGDVDEQQTCPGGPGKDCGKGFQNVDSIQCDCCSKWFHADCQNMSPEELAFFGKPGRIYICIECSTDVGDLFKAKDFLKDLGSKVQFLESEIKETKDRVASLETKTDYKESDEFKEAVWDELEKFRVEEEEKARRKPNLIIRGLEEPDETDNERRYVVDEQKVKDIAKSIGVNESVQIKSMVRLGNPQTSVSNSGGPGTSSQRPRLLKVVLDNEDTKWTMVKASRNLKENENLRHIAIMPDRTLNERRKHADLVKVRDEKNYQEQETGKKWIIKRGRLMRIDENQPTRRY